MALLTVDEFNAKSQELLTKLSDQGEVTNILADLQQGFVETLAACNAARSENDELKAKNTKLNDDNMKLYLRVTVPEGEAGQQVKKPDTPETALENLYTNGRLNLKG